MTLEEKIEVKVKELEISVNACFAFTEDPKNSEDDRRLVAFRLFSDMINLNCLVEYSTYKPSRNTVSVMTDGLKGVGQYVTISSGKVEIDPAYRALLAQRDSFLSDQKN